ncbi:hypothetical protein BH683_016805 [Williamsia sp. 1138]|nr:hypothetical protein BH683_016805 [Williamsia sp. 1138]
MQRRYTSAVGLFGRRIRHARVKDEATVIQITSVVERKGHYAWTAVSSTESTSVYFRKRFSHSTKDHVGRLLDHT